eukprot:1704866-Prymnesium_polylepis.1
MNAKYERNPDPPHRPSDPDTPADPCPGHYPATRDLGPRTRATDRRASHLNLPQEIPRASEPRTLHSQWPSGGVPRMSRTLTGPQVSPSPRWQHYMQLIPRVLHASFTVAQSLGFPRMSRTFSFAIAPLTRALLKRKGLHALVTDLVVSETATSCGCFSRCRQKEAAGLQRRPRPAGKGRAEGLHAFVANLVDAKPELLELHHRPADEGGTKGLHTLHHTLAANLVVGQAEILKFRH